MIPNPSSLSGGSVQRASARRVGCLLVSISCLLVFTALVAGATLVVRVLFW